MKKGLPRLSYVAAINPQSKNGLRITISKSASTISSEGLIYCLYICFYESVRHLRNSSSVDRNFTLICAERLYRLADVFCGSESNGAWLKQLHWKFYNQSLN